MSVDAGGQWEVGFVMRGFITALSCLLSFFPFGGKAGAKGQQLYLLPLCLSLKSDGTTVNFIFHYVGLNRDLCY